MASAAEEATQRVETAATAADTSVLNTELRAQARDNYSEQKALSDSDGAADTAAADYREK